MQIKTSSSVNPHDIEAFEQRLSAFIETNKDVASGTDVLGYLTDALSDARYVREQQEEAVAADRPYFNAQSEWGTWNKACAGVV